MKRQPTGKVRRGTRAFRALREEALNQLGPNGWQIWACPICRQHVTHPSNIHLDHYGIEVWLHDPGNKHGIEAQTIRENSRLICASCNTTRGRGRTDQRVAQLRARKIRKTKRNTPPNQSAWVLPPKKRDNE